MKKIDIKPIIKTAQQTLTKHSPEILTGIGIAGMVTSIVLAVKATPKAYLIVNHEEKHNDVTLKPLEKVRLCWKCYIPTAITCTASIACLVSGSTVSFKRNTAITAAYTLTEKAFSEYKDKVVETFGEKKESIIKEKIAEDKIAAHPVETSNVIVTGNGETLFYDTHTGIYFKSTIDMVKNAKNELNSLMLSEMYVSLNDFYYLLGIEATKNGDELGWNMDKGLIDITISPHLASDNTPCIAISYTIQPRNDYYNFT